MNNKVLSREGSQLGIFQYEIPPPGHLSFLSTFCTIEKNTIMDIILATSNPSKARQINEIFAGSNINVISMEEAGIDQPIDDIETGETLEENAAIKARYAQVHAPGSWTIADDTGIFVHALDDFPGVHSARWLGKDATTEQIMHGMLKKMDGLQDRSATFKTTVVLVSPDGNVHSFSGERSGQVLKTPRCAPQPKMPYSSIFLPDGAEKVWAEMRTEEENQGSHRGKAFRQALEFLKQHA